MWRIISNNIFQYKNTIFQYVIVQRIAFRLQYNVLYFATSICLFFIWCTIVIINNNNFCTAHHIKYDSTSTYILQYFYIYALCYGKLFQAQELAVVEEVMRMMLEIFNSCLSSSLHHNPHLIYTMLYQRALFSQLLAHPTFQDVVQNIDTVSEL